MPAPCAAATWAASHGLSGMPIVPLSPTECPQPPMTPVAMLPAVAFAAIFRKIESGTSGFPSSPYPQKKKDTDSGGAVAPTAAAEISTASCSMQKDDALL